ncbi:MAG TPA: protease, partial [Algoriphagus sp.]|nr:protease [Algoriphagus sp.]
MYKATILSFLFISIFYNQSKAQEKPGYFMHPDLHENTMVFVAEGDIWTASVSGGMATRLTTHPGDESDPKISPDGKWVAYAASYEGPTEVYVMPISGGLPKRLTYEPSASIPVAWRSATELAYTTNQYSTLPRLRTVVVDVNSRVKEVLPLEMAAEGSFDRESNTYFFVRPTYHNNVTKRYQGGTARQLWKYSNGAAEAVKLTKDYAGEDHHPIFHQGRVYFISSRDGIQNVWSMKPDG